MAATKEAKIQEMREWLIANDVEFVERTNGFFSIYIYGEPYMDLWTTTERFMVTQKSKDGATTPVARVGLHLAKKYIEKAYTEVNSV